MFLLVNQSDLRISPLVEQIDQKIIINRSLPLRHSEVQKGQRF